MLSKDRFLDIWDPVKCASNYGVHLHDSSLVDYIEWAVVCGVSIPLETFIESLLGAGVSKEIDPHWIERGEESSRARDARETIKAVINERMTLLGDGYPFALDHFGRLHLRKELSFETSIYMRLLCVSILQGWIVRGSDEKRLQTKIAGYFEYIVNACIESAGYDSVIVGTASSNDAFSNKLTRSAKSLGLAASAERQSRSSHAKDDGVDILAGKFWRDGRKGEILFLVQATCGYEKNWRAKLSSVPLTKWAGYFDEMASPYGVLAVPYHVTSCSSQALLQDAGNRTFLDRLRITALAGLGSVDFSDFSDLNEEIKGVARERISWLADGEGLY